MVRQILLLLKISTMSVDSFEVQFSLVLVLILVSFNLFAAISLKSFWRGWPKFSVF